MKAPRRFPIAAPQFLDPYEAIRHTENRLPHRQQQAVTYFLTFHLADSMPDDVRSRWVHERDAWLRTHPGRLTLQQDLEYHRRFSGAMERWLDAGHGACVLRSPRCAEAVADALHHFDGERCYQYAWVIMPNHIHVLMAPCALWRIEQLVHSWKRFTARRINELLGREGVFWQRDYFDRIVRDEKHFGNCVRYIRRNPEKAGLGIGAYRLYESEFAKVIE